MEVSANADSQTIGIREWNQHYPYDRYHRLMK